MEHFHGKTGAGSIYSSTVKGDNCSCDNMERSTTHTINKSSSGSYVCDYCCTTFVTVAEYNKLKEQLKELLPRTPQQYVPLQWKD